MYISEHYCVFLCNFIKTKINESKMSASLKMQL